MALSCTRATSPLDELNTDEFEPDFNLLDYLKDVDLAYSNICFDDNASMIVHNSSLLEMSNRSSSKSQPSMINVGKHDFLKRFSAFRRKKTERLPSKTFPIFDQRFSKTHHDAVARGPQALFSTMSHFDISTVERRIELSELDRRNSIGNETHIFYDHSIT